MDSLIVKVARGLFLVCLCAAAIPSSYAQDLTSTLTFEGFQDSTQVTSQYPGVFFTGATVITAGVSLNEVEFPPASGQNVLAASGTVSVGFDSLVASFAGRFTYGTQIKIAAYDASGNLVASATSQFSNNEAVSGDPGSKPNESIIVTAAGGIATVTVSSGANETSFTADDVQIGLPVSNSSGPLIFPGGVVTSSSSSISIEPGAWVSLFGINLASGVTVWSGDFPTSLGGVTVTINGIPAYLSYVSPTQINMQAPDDTATGPVPVSVIAQNATAVSSVVLAPVAPSFFLLDATHVAGIILRQNGLGAYGGGSYDILGPTGTSLGYKTVAAAAGDVVELYGTGFGPTNPDVVAGQAFSGAAPTVGSVSIFINNAEVTPTFAGLSAAGLDQINIVLPGGLGTGDVPLQGLVAGVATSPNVLISLQ